MRGPAAVKVTGILVLALSGVLGLSHPTSAQATAAGSPELTVDRAGLEDEGRLMLEEGRRLAAAGRPHDALPFYTQALDMAQVALD
ncbi:MAG: hypothetical protein AAGM22_29180, partial [Acidobacteriota bacterium]